MNAREAMTDDREVIQGLYREFMAEQPPPAYLGDILDEELAEVDDAIAKGRAFVVEEEEGQAVGFALAWRKRGAVGYLSDLYVLPEARERGAASSLMRAVVDGLRAQGVSHLTLNVDVANTAARVIYGRWHFVDESLNLVAELETLAERLERRPRGESFGSIHVQTDDLPAVEKAVRRFVPLLRGGSQGTVIAPPRGGWIAVYDELGDREPAQLRRLARELSDGSGAVVLAIGVEEGAVAHYVMFERGKAVDEYMSVPEHFGPKPPGEVVSLAANPTLVKRLTGADRQVLRTAAVQAQRVDDLPPASEIVGAVGRAMGIEGTDHGFAGVPELEGAVRVERS